LPSWWGQLARKRTLLSFCWSCPSEEGGVAPLLTDILQSGVTEVKEFLSHGADKEEWGDIVESGARGGKRRRKRRS